MGTKIEWATKVWNPITGCKKGCSWCYARRFAERMKSNPNPKIAAKYRNGFEPTVHRELVFDVKKWRKPQRVFVGSMGDLFDPEFGRAPFWNLMFEMSVYTKHTFMLLTKQPENMLRYANMWCEFNKIKQIPSNIWCGVTVTNQDEADRMIPVLLRVPALFHFVSIEPMCGPISMTNMDVEKAGDKEWCFINALNGKHDDMGRPCADVPKLDWVIVGGMTGPKSTPTATQWVHSIQRQCEYHGTPFFFKGWGDWGKSDKEDRRLSIKRWKWIDVVNGDLCNAVDPFPEKNEKHHHELMVKLGRKLAGRLLGGKEYNEFPNYMTGL